MTYELIQKVKETCPDAICTECFGEGIYEGTNPENSAAYAAYCQSCNETGIEPGYEEIVQEIKNQMTMKTNHTKGKWTASIGSVYSEEDGRLIANLSENNNQHYLRERNENLANAKLIAAAPVLLEALTDVLTELKQGFKPYGAVHESLIKNIESAIKKAIE